MFTSLSNNDRHVSLTWLVQMVTSLSNNDRQVSLTWLVQMVTTISNNDQMTQSIKTTTMENMCNIISMEQAGLIRKKVRKFRKSQCLTDVEIICQNGSVYLHKILLFQMLPKITSFLCDLCDNHGETIFILPEVTKEEIESEVKNLCSFGIILGLLEIF